MEYAGVVRPAFMEEPASGGVRTALAKPSGSSCGRKVRQKDEDDPWAFRVASTTKKITRPMATRWDTAIAVTTVACAQTPWASEKNGCNKEGELDVIIWPVFFFTPAVPPDCGSYMNMKPEETVWMMTVARPGRNFCSTTNLFLTMYGRLVKNVMDTACAQERSQH
jgi:hypothetical protein